ncbi:hypothetical protein MaudCBS49596_006867 [Microsporum audouinii]
MLGQDAVAVASALPASISDEGNAAASSVVRAGITGRFEVMLEAMRIVGFQDCNQMAVA